MAMVVVNTFKAEVPRFEPNLLPDQSAQYARDIDVRTGALRPMIGTSPISAVAQAVQSLYTENGWTFFTWTSDVDACKSLVIGDQYQRVYYTDGSFYYGTSATYMTATGGPPTTAWRQGVQPPNSFSLTGIKNATSWPDGITVSARFFYESNSIKYQETAVSLIQVGSEVGRQYTFTPPVIDSSAASSITIQAAGYSIGGQSNFFTKEELVTIVSSTQVQSQSIGIVDAQYVIRAVLNPGNLFNPVTFQFVSVENLWNDGQTTDKTPSSAVPVLQITGVKGAETMFTLFSEGSSLVRADQPARVSIAQIDGSNDYKASIEWGGNGVLGKSIVRKTSAYVATCVNIYGEESKPSNPITVTTDYLQSASFLLSVPSQNGFAATTQIRIYETVTGSRDTAYHLSLQASQANGTSAAYDVANALVTINPTLETIGWDVPPAGVSGLQPTPFGSYVMFKGSELYWTEQYRPHTTPGKYVMTFPNNIKSIKQTAFGLIVVTTAQGYLVTGLSPDSMARQELPVRASIVSKRAITVHGGAGWFASEDGLVMVQGVSATLAPWQQLFTREKWRARYASQYANLVLASHDGFLVGLLPSGDGFLMRLDEDEGEFTRLSITGNCAFVLPQTDGMYIGTQTGIVQFAAGAELTGQWQSKQFTIPTPVNFGCMEVAGSGLIPYQINADGNLVASGVIAPTARGAMIRLPAGFKAQRWDVTLTVSAGGYVSRLVLAEHPKELAGV